MILISWFSGLSRRCFLLLFLLTNCVSVALSSTDSLFQKFIDEDLPDTVRLKAIDDLGWILVFEDPDSAFSIARREFLFASQHKYPKWQSNALNTMGISFHMKSDYETALDYYQQSLRIRDQMNDSSGMAISYGNMGLLYEDLSDYEKALEYQLKSLRIEEGSGNKRGIASSLGNIGSIYMELKDYKKALEYQLKSLKLEEEINNKPGIAGSLGNIGLIYIELGEFNKALEYQLRCLEIENEMENIYGIATIKGNIAGNFHRRKNYQEAIRWATEAIELMYKIGDIDAIKDYTLTKYLSYKSIGQYKEALDNFEEYITLRDSIFKEENQAAITRKEISFEFEKKALADSIRVADEMRIRETEQQAELKRQGFQKYTLFAGLGVLILFIGFVLNRFAITKKQKKIIEEQKYIVEEKQKEILDSINYAKRLQDAILATPEEINYSLKDNFLLYKPKDIVAGDFYFFETHRDHIFIAAADCTGHGVPGAMVSIVCDNALTRSIKEFNLSDPGEILDQTRELVLDRFKKSGQEIKDGMDISILAINRVTNKICWSGANLPLWVISGSSNGQKELMEYRPNKQPIGKSENPVLFKTHLIEQRGDDTMYLFTDGFQDQFGGSAASGSKKFKKSRMKELLLSLHDQPLKNQSTVLNEVFESWKGEMEQIDDVCVIGLKWK